MKVVYLSQPTFLRTIARKVAGFFLLVVLASCGGGSSNDSGGTTATQLQGYYQGTVGGKEFISLVLPANAGIARWYGWYFKVGTPDANPYLYSGNLTLGVNGAAQSNGANIRIYESGTLGSRSANFSQSSLNSFQATINNVVSQTSETISATAQGILQSSLQGTWNGTWSSAGNILPSRNIIFDVNGALTSMQPFDNCKVNTNELQLTAIAGNLYDAAITLRSDQPTGNCSWVPVGSTSITFSGIAFLHASPAINKTKRLELMLLDTDGSGISFRGDM